MFSHFTTYINFILKSYSYVIFPEGVVFHIQSYLLEKLALVKCNDLQQKLRTFCYYLIEKVSRTYPMDGAFHLFRPTTCANFHTAIAIVFLTESSLISQST